MGSLKGVHYDSMGSAIQLMNSTHWPDFYKDLLWPYSLNTETIFCSVLSLDSEPVMLKVSHSHCIGEVVEEKAYFDHKVTYSQKVI